MQLTVAAVGYDGERTVNDCFYERIGCEVKHGAMKQNAMSAHLSQRCGSSA